MTNFHSGSVVAGLRTAIIKGVAAYDLGGHGTSGPGYVLEVASEVTLKFHATVNTTSLSAL